MSKQSEEDKEFDHFFLLQKKGRKYYKKLKRIEWDIDLESSFLFYTVNQIWLYDVYESLWFIEYTV